MHPNLVSLWKKQALESLPEAFVDKRGGRGSEDRELTERLYQQIGRLQVELEWLKKKTGYPA